MRATWKALGLNREAIEVLDSIVVRESHGDRCAVHVLGRNEYGLGPGGLQVRFNLHRWDPKADPRVLQDPEVSAVVMARLLRKYKKAYRAKTWLRVGQLYGGRIKYPDIGMDELWCERLARRDVDCHAPVGDLGKKLGVGPTEDQERFVAIQRAKNTYAWVQRKTRKKRRSE